MPRLPINAILTQSRRCYSVVTAEIVLPGVVPAVMTPPQVEAGAVEKKTTQAFWMKDPKTGNWVPENRIDGDVDAVDIRLQLLKKKP